MCIRDRPGLAPDEIMEACFDDLLCGQGEGTGWRQHRLPVNKNPDLIVDNSINTRVTGDFLINDAMLWGGNLTVLTGLLATPFFPRVKGGILFLEDVGEHPYRIEPVSYTHLDVYKRQG